MVNAIMADTTAAREYLKEHKILELFDNLTSQLFFHRPEHPKVFLKKILQHLEESRTAGSNPPTLMDDTNIESIFCMMDPTGKGFVNFDQYMHAMTTLGIQDYDQKPSGYNLDRITYEVFKFNAKRGINDQAKAYSFNIGAEPSSLSPAYMTLG